MCLVRFTTEIWNTETWNFALQKCKFWPPWNLVGSWNFRTFSLSIGSGSDHGD